MEPANKRKGRAPAGQDPAKRRQILDGAYRVFLDRGFDAASMNDITREAGVSKGTIYVYFRSKEDLLEALVDDERSRLSGEMLAIFEQDGPFESLLQRFAAALIRLSTRADAIRAQRTIIAISERMPALGRRYRRQGPLETRRALAAFLSARMATRGARLEDPETVASVFIDLCAGRLVAERLYGMESAEPGDTEIADAARRAVGVFCAALDAGVL